jgi:hypothetical protein
MSAVATEVPVAPAQAATIPEPVQMSTKDLRANERLLATSSDRDAIVRAVFSLYRFHFCRIGEEASLQRLAQLLSRNRYVDKAQSRGGGCLDLQMKGEHRGTLMLYTVMPACP